ncbi:MAG: restriction endonuclease [Candidatus Saccharibacteria bacterium]
MSQPRRYPDRTHHNRHQNSRPPRPYVQRKPYYGKKRQANSRELSLTLAVIVVFAVAAIGSRLSSDSLPYIIAVVVVLLGMAAAIVFYMAFRKQRELRAIQLSGVDVMDGFVFEKYVAELLKNEGFTQVTITEKYDLGIDVIADRDGERWGIQVKRNRGKTKAESVRAAVTALSHYKCTRAMVVSNSLFTGSARQLAQSNNCVLIDRGRLGEWIVHYQHRR